MTDIHTIKNLIYFLPYLKEETWYMLGIGITVYIIYIAYLIAFERYYKSQNTALIITPVQEPFFLEKLHSLEVDDIHFFERLSFLIRSHLEESKQVPLATKKTRRDIHKESISPELGEILDICTYYEYTKDLASTEKKMEIMERLKSVM